MRRTCSETRSEKAERPVRGEGPEGKGPLFSDRRERVSERQRVWPREASPRASSGLLREAERSRVTVKALDIGRASSPLHDRPHLRRLDQVDPYLLIATLLLIGYGLVMTYSVTAESRTFTGDPMQFVVRGAIWAAIGVAAMVIVAMFDYAWLGTFAPLIYLLMLGLLVVGLAMLGPAVALVYKQPDLGTSLVFIAIFFGIAFLAGARVWQLVGLVAVAGASFPLIWSLLKPYQQGRLLAFLDPYSDPQGAGWNIIQSLIAVGSGQATGKGLTAGTQSPLGYLPIAESDFVFAGLAEDLGFVGAVILFALYIVLIFAALRIAYRARDPFGMLLGGGVAAMLLFQILVNVGMAVSLMPVTGIPLPFISHGGSSLVSICFALGVLQSVSMRREPEGP